MSKKQSLGKGLSALISPDTISQLEQNNVKTELIKSIPIEKIKPNPYQPRRTFDENSIKELSSSMLEYGVLQPIVVCKISEKDEFFIIAGERRYRAAQKINYKIIPAIIKTITKKELLEIALVENIQREDLNAIDEAEAYCKLIEQYSYTQMQLAEKFGKSRSYIANTIRLLKLPEDIKNLIKNRKLSASHARTIASSENPEELVKRINEENLSVRNLEKIIKFRKKKTVFNTLHNKAHISKDPDLVRLEKTLEKALKTTVKIISTEKDDRMQIILELDNMDQFDYVIATLLNNKIRF